jgi:hypothetical protein
MRLRTAAALAGMALAAASCGISGRSDDFRCEGPADCSDGRLCVDGWCVRGEGGDAAPAADADLAEGADASAACPERCTSCQNGACVIDCPEDNSCSTLVLCPPGMPCRVDCDGEDACDAGIDCSAAAECNIDCDGTGSCDGPITCGPGPCDVDCEGSGTCDQGIDCSDSCRNNSCDIPPLCPIAECVDGIDCTDIGADCRDC